MSLLAKFVDEDFGYVQSGEAWGRSVKHDSLVVNILKGLWYWNSKDESGNTEDYLCKVRKMSREDARKLMDGLSGKLLVPITNTDIVVPHEALVDVLWKNGAYDRDYWYNRCLTDATINRHRLGFYNDKFIVPVYRKGTLVNFQCRKEIPEKAIFWWYSKTDIHSVLFQESILNYSDTVFIVEGLLDSLLLGQHGIPSVAPCGGNLGWKDIWFQKFIRTKHIYAIGDNDCAGDEFLRRISDSLGKHRVNCYKFADEKKGFDSVDFFRDGGTQKDYIETITEKSSYFYEMEL